MRGLESFSDGEERPLQLSCRGKNCFSKKNEISFFEKKLEGYF